MQATVFSASSHLEFAEPPTQEELRLIPPHLKDLWQRNPDCEFLQRLIKNYDLFLDIYKGCGNQFGHGCGSYLFNGQTYTYDESVYPKQKLLYEAAKQSSHVLEVGVYMGHSLLIMLLANPHLSVTCVDIDDRYSGPAVEVLKKRFGDRIHFIKGDSLAVLPQLEGRFDLFHIDSSHDSAHLVPEFSQCLKKCLKPHVFCIIDDYDCYAATVNQLFTSNTSYRVLHAQVPSCPWRNAVAELEMQGL